MNIKFKVMNQTFEIENGGTNLKVTKSDGKIFYVPMYVITRLNKINKLLQERLDVASHLDEIEKELLTELT